MTPFRYPDEHKAKFLSLIEKPQYYTKTTGRYNYRLLAIELGVSEDYCRRLKKALQSVKDRGVVRKDPVKLGIQRIQTRERVADHRNKMPKTPTKPKTPSKRKDAPSVPPSSGKKQSRTAVNALVKNSENFLEASKGHYDFQSKLLEAKEREHNSHRKAEQKNHEDYQASLDEQLSASKVIFDKTLKAKEDTDAKILDMDAEEVESDPETSVDASDSEESVLVLDDDDNSVAIVESPPRRSGRSVKAPASASKGKTPTKKPAASSIKKPAVGKLASESDESGGLGSDSEEESPSPKVARRSTRRTPAKPPRTPATTKRAPTAQAPASTKKSGKMTNAEKAEAKKRARLAMEK